MTSCPLKAEQSSLKNIYSQDGIVANWQICQGHPNCFPPHLLCILWNIYTEESYQYVSSQTDPFQHATYVSMLQVELKVLKDFLNKKIKLIENNIGHYL